MPQHIIVLEYDRAWPLKYEKEKEKITAILRESCAGIWHIGSTAVPGLAAKPILDILCAVQSLKDVDALSEGFTRIGYEYLGEFGIPGRRYLRKGGDERTHQIHIFQANDQHNIRRHLAVRDYLRSHETARAAYAELKKKLAQRFPYDIESYCDGKEEFVRRMEALALDWYSCASHDCPDSALQLRVT